MKITRKGDTVYFLKPKHGGDYTNHKHSTFEVKEGTYMAEHPIKFEAMIFPDGGLEIVNIPTRFWFHEKYEAEIRANELNTETMFHLVERVNALEKKK